MRHWPIYKILVCRDFQTPVREVYQTPVDYKKRLEFFRVGLKARSIVAVKDMDSKNQTATVCLPL